MRILNTKLRIVFITGACLIFVALLVPWAILSSDLQLPIWLQVLLKNIQTTYYWLIPVILIMFLQPVILDYTRRPDINFRFTKRSDGNILIIITNRGATAFSFNRLQFYVRRFYRRRSGVASPADGKLRKWWFRKAGDTVDHEVNVEAGCTVERGIPLTIWTMRSDICEWLNGIKERVPGKAIFCRIYFDGTEVEAKSKQAVPGDIIESCLTKESKTMTYMEA